MGLLLSKLDQFQQRWFSRTYGWTGVEIGCHAINMAQVQRIGERWQLAAVWSVEHPTTYAVAAESKRSLTDETFGWLPMDQLCEHGLAPTLEFLENLNSLFHGRFCAATLTDGMVSYRELDLPLADSVESKSMVHSEIAIETECELEELLTDCWELPQYRARANTRCLGAVSLKRSAAMFVASDLLKAGFECQVLDAVPCVMARCTSMVVDDLDASTLAIDLGYNQVTITLVRAGQPLFSRGLRSLGLVPLLEKIAATFEISMSDAQTLLFQSPNNRTNEVEGRNEFSNPIHQTVSEYLGALSSEIEKTVHFASRSCPAMAPCQLLLMGAGVRIPQSDSALEERVGLPTHTWAIDVAENLFGNQHLATYAMATGLSALAWEALACT
jgi:Tfp pilus assembly PilM family ATPase